MARDIKQDDYIITKSIAKTVLEIPGVSRLSSSITDNLSKVMLVKKQNVPGVSLNQDEKDAFTVTLHITVVYGVNIPQVSYDIQIAVKEMLEKKFKITAKEINVFVEGVDATKGNI